MEILAGEIKTNEMSENAAGGSELIARKIAQVVPMELLKECQIINTRVRELAPDKIRVLVIHDLPGDPECDHLKNGGYKRFHLIVFVSNWQMQQFCAHYKIPYEVCCVIKNAVVPSVRAAAPLAAVDTPVKLVYHTTPHRGLEILVPVVEALNKDGKNVTLDVFSSFNLYGWPQRDEQYRHVFDKIDADPTMTNHGFRPNDEVRALLPDYHIFSYPSIWMETSCICLMEAMSAGLVCVHPNLGALFETAANWTRMYQWSENSTIHAKVFYDNLSSAVDSVRTGNSLLGYDEAAQKTYADFFYSWNGRQIEWTNTLEHLVSNVKDRSIQTPPAGPSFTYQT